MCTFTSILFTDQWHEHDTCPCYMLGISSMYIKYSPMKKDVQFLFVNILCFLTFFLYFHGIDKFELKKYQLMYNLFGGAVTLQNCGLMLPFDKSST